MTNKRQHGIAYQVWNQTRLAKHVDEYLQLYEALGGSGPTSIPAAVRRPMLTASRALFQTIVVHLDMIGASQGVSIRKLNDRAFKEQLIPETTYLEIKSILSKHNKTLHNIKLQRNNIIAHRSENLTFAEIKDQHAVTDAELRSLTDDYYKMASKLHQHMEFREKWKRIDQSGPNQMLMRYLESHS